MAKVRVFVSNISSPPLKRRYKRYEFSYFFCNVFTKNLKVYNLLFSYYELGFRYFELNLFSHCFDSVRFEKFKPEQALRTLDWKT